MEIHWSCEKSDNNIDCSCLPGATKSTKFILILYLEAEILWDKLQTISMNLENSSVDKGNNSCGLKFVKKEEKYFYS